MVFSIQCNKRYVLTEEASSEICILDLDSFGGEQKWKEFRKRHPQWPLILISINSHEIADQHTLFLQKPIQVERLVSTIEEHRNSLSALNKSSMRGTPARNQSPLTGHNSDQPIPATIRRKSQSSP
jgi:DNA-binding NtrC family response regulator